MSDFSSKFSGNNSTGNKGAAAASGGFADKFKKDTPRTTNEYVDIAKRADGDRVFLVTGQNQGKDAWYYVLVEKTKLPLFKEKVKTDFIDLSQFGEILYCGWGKEAPEEISEKIKKDFF